MRELSKYWSKQPIRMIFSKAYQTRNVPDQVFCFTPVGDVIVLPSRATPVDFAYAVHSEIGDHCVGA